MAKRKGRQTPTVSVYLRSSKTKAGDAIAEYEKSGRKAQKWQKLLLKNIMAVNRKGLWIHTKFGYSVPRRNGKNEVVVIREIAELMSGKKTLHTAHRTTTSHAAAVRLAQILSASGYEEVQRVKKREKYDRHYTFSKQFGLEKITLLSTGGTVDFRTRSGKGGLGEGFDLLVIDEAQEYTDDQETALKYVVSDSENPQTIFCGTPPTAVSTGTVFVKMRAAALKGETKNTGWAEWSVDHQTDPNDVESWYETNPSLGMILTERKITDEIGPDVIDFNIQRLGLWIQYNQASAITETEWNVLTDRPELTGKLTVGIKFGQDGSNVAMSLAVRTTDGRIYVEAIDCRSVRDGVDWMLVFLHKQQKNVNSVIIDGAAGQQLMQDAMKEAKLKSPVFPKVKEIITANAKFENAIYQKTLCHAVQPSLDQVVTNCEKRNIGTGGGFGYKALIPEHEIALMDSVILAHWGCSEIKEPQKQRVGY